MIAARCRPIHELRANRTRLARTPHGARAPPDALASRSVSAALFVRCPIRLMSTFVCCLLSNLALLAAVHLACGCVRAMHPDLRVRGTRVFIGLIVLAFMFDAALTFLVFADAGGPWRNQKPAETFFARTVAYLLAAVLAIVLARVGRGRVARRATPPGAIEIETSPYTKSTLPM